MALITAPIAIRFANEFARPMAEILNDAQVNLRDFQRTYDAQIGPLVGAAADGDIIEDGRAAQGVSRLTKKDVVDFAAQVDALLAVIDAVGALDVITKPKVRGLR